MTKYSILYHLGCELSGQGNQDAIDPRGLAHVMVTFRGLLRVTILRPYHIRSCHYCLSI